jgi:hypothetical protein
MTPGESSLLRSVFFRARQKILELVLPASRGEATWSSSPRIESDGEHRQQGGVDDFHEA